MKKKRILYSELAAPPPVVRAAEQPLPASVPAEPTIAALAPVRAVAAPTAVRPVAALAHVRPVAATPRLLRDQARARTGRAEILLFRVADERFGIDLAAVEEAIDIPPVHHVPEMPPAMLGVITVRAMLTSVYSPAAALGLSLHDGTSALIFRRGASRIAIVVDEVDDVTTLDLALLRDAPALDAGAGIVLGVVRQHDVLLALVDADALIAACQAAPLLETA
jgi:purine-binding chemotaxis protein CheW